MVVSIIACVVAVKTYMDNKQFKFFLRRDHLFKRILDLRAMNSEFSQSLLRYEIGLVKLASLELKGEQAESMTAIVADSKGMLKGWNELKTKWDEHMERIDAVYKSLIPKTDTALEEFINLVQEEMVGFKKIIDITLNSMYVNETAYPLIRDHLAEFN